VVYSGGYFADPARRPAALAGLLAFLAAMQGLVLADGYLTLLVFWELVGALSARLIAFNREDPAAAPAAVRAFLTTRAADAGLYVALLALYAGAGTLAFGADRPEGVLGALVGLGLVLAAIGKSAQAPLQTWLTAAMAGPTPVSALLHSATMVAAGVYLLMRSDALLAGWPLEVAGWIGALTAVAGAAIALAQTDLKRVLAGSTTSQLGLMFVGVAAGGPAVALFHLVAHAAGKATMFLAAGIFGHERGGTGLEDLRGAGRDDRRTFAAFAIGALSIAAVPPFAAFFSKDVIVAAAEEHPAWLVLVLVAAAGSAAYLLRPALVLWGEPSDARVRVPALRGRRVMLAATGTLAAASVALGVLGDPLRTLLDAPELPSSLLSVALSAVAVAAGVVVVLRRVRVPARLAAAAEDQLHVDTALRAIAQRPALASAAALARLDDGVVDRIVDDAGRATLVLARSQRWVEARGVDAAVDGLARLVGRAGAQSPRLQTGRLHEYLRDTVLGAAAVVALITLAAVL
nr:NADH-quinone oxidoreductase subunit L [Solirubrobacterales bacterium]